MKKTIVFILLALFLAVTSTCIAKINSKYDLPNATVVIYLVKQTKTGLEAQGHGSGTILQIKNGKTYILTANHVVAHLSEDKDLALLVTEQAKDVKGLPARVLLQNPAKDAAILEVDGVVKNKTDVPLCALAPKTFDYVLAIGAPGPLEISPAEGIVSGYYAVDPEYTLGITIPLIIHSAQLIPGMSGGGLFTTQMGKWCLIGVNIQYNSNYHSVNYAVPVEQLQPTLNEVLNAN